MLDVLEHVLVRLASNRPTFAIAVSTTCDGLPQLRKHAVLQGCRPQFESLSFMVTVFEATKFASGNQRTRRFIDLPLPLCENPRKRLILRGQ
jgi:hypothetical protein